MRSSYICGASWNFLGKNADSGGEEAEEIGRCLFGGDVGATQNLDGRMHSTRQAPTVDEGAFALAK